jgi:subtilisin family serine protease/fibronectin type 3 domain-containing protein
MRIRTRPSQYLALFITAALTAVVLAARPASAQEVTPPGNPAATHSAHGRSGPEAKPGRIVVRLKPGAVPGDLAGTLAAAGGRIDRSFGRGGFVRVGLPDGADASAVIAALRANPAVAEAGADLVARAFDIPNDPGYSQQWDLQPGDGGINVQGAWDLGSSRGAGVTVAVIDTGIAYENYAGGQALFGQKVFAPAPDLAGVPIVAPWDWIDGDSHANDENGHGTHVAGTIAEAKGNGVAEAGISAASLMPLRILDFSGNGSASDLIDAIYYAADHGAKVVNLSLGFSGTGAPDANGEACTEIVGLGDALDYAYAMGVTVVAASGNDGAGTVACPAAYPTVIAVGATRYDGSVTFYSNSGSALSVTAPGGDPNVDQNGDGVADQITQQTYCLDAFLMYVTGQHTQFCDMLFSGTSMASPHVAATAAMLIGQVPTLSPGQLRDVLQATARDRGAAGWDPQYGWGLIDAEAALASVINNPPPPPPPGPAPTPRPVPQPGATNVTGTALSTSSIRLTWTDSASGESGFRIDRSADNGATWAQAGMVGANTTVFTNYGLQAATTYLYRVRSYDSLGTSVWSEAVSVTTLPPPTPPSGLSATVLGATSIQLSWTDNSSTEQGFKVERSTDGINYTVSTYFSANATSGTVGSLTPSTTYWLRVFAYDGTAKSDPTNTVQATTFELPAAPSNLTALAISPTAITLTWTDNSTSEQGFKVERSLDGGTTWSLAAQLPANTVAWTNSNLQAATTYWYRARGYSGSLLGDASEVASAQTLPAPSAPTGLTATALSASSIRLNWIDTSSYEQGFKLERSSDGGVTWTQFATAGANATTATANSLAPSTLYSFRVRAYQGSANGDYSEIVSATTLAPPSAPANLAAQAMSTTSIKLTWVNTTATQTYVKIERSTDGAAFSQVALVLGTATTWTSSSLQAGTTYYFRVRANAGSVDGPYGEVVSATTWAPPSAPTGVTAVATSATSVKLTWTDTCSYESGFRVERSLDGVTWTQVAVLVTNATSWTNTGLVTQTAYQYRIRAYQSTTYGEYSAVAFVTTP